MGYGTDPGEYGDDCLCCWPPGQTPKAAYISYEGMKKCPGLGEPPPGPANASVEVVQQAYDSCWWHSGVGHWAFDWVACGEDESFCYQVWEHQNMFKGVHEGNCGTHFENVLVCPASWTAAEGGAASVVFNMGHLDHSIGSLLHAINMQPDPETKFEFWPAEKGRLMVRFARKKDATNILILVEPENL